MEKVQLTDLLPRMANESGFAPGSRIWVYICDREMTDAEAQFVEQQALAFCKNWTAHSQALRASAEVFHKRVLLLLVDETRAGASGCSIDKSVHFLEYLGTAMKVDFFDRMQFAWVEGGGFRFGDRALLAQALAEGQIEESTLMLNTLIAQKDSFSEKWLLPWGKSWHKQLV